MRLVPAPSQPRAAAPHADRLRVAAHPSPASVLRAPPALGDHRRRGRAEQIAAAIKYARAGRTEPPTIELTDRRGNTYTRRSSPLSAASINKTITRLGQILEDAVEYGYLDRNPARGKRRRLKAAKAAPVWLDRAEHIEALLAAAGQLDDEARADRSHIARRAIIATLVFAGLRIGELTQLRWRDVDLAGNRITVGEAKTDAGTGRIIDLLPALRDELAAYKATRTAAAPTGPTELVYPTSAGRRLSEDNIRDRVFARAVERANQLLDDAGDVPLPERLTPHKLRHTFASLLVALGVDPGAVMDQLGHTDATFTLRVYRHGMRRDPAAKAALHRLVGVAPRRIWALERRIKALVPFQTPRRRSPRTHFGHTKTPPKRGFHRTRPAGFEPATFRSGGERSIP
jgi:integrase